MVSPLETIFKIGRAYKTPIQNLSNDKSSHLIHKILNFNHFTLLIFTISYTIFCCNNKGFDMLEQMGKQAKDAAFILAQLNTTEK
ncbi:MAG: hypothetical protein E6001_09570, partial [Haemophilus parainfluenzae]|nr:hypothetical protein [Haemophilus parainfluenzae]